jgi:hypothetical protein
MIATLLTISLIALLLVASQAWWRSLFNPVTFGILSWTPGLILMHWPPFFLSPLYIHLNRPLSPLLYVAVPLAFMSFWAGCAIVKVLSPADAYVRKPANLAWRANLPRTLVLFAMGFFIFIYAYMNSGLLDMQYLDDVGVAESRLRLHFGWASFLILFMDVGGILMFTRFLQRGNLLYALPMLIALLCQAATLQKSRFMFLLLGCIFVACLYPKETYRLFLSSLPRRSLVVGAGIAALSALLAMNAARGIAVVQMTSAASPIYEQIYIYSNASAIQNVSVTLEGYIASDPPAFGAYMLRPILWHFVDRDLFFATRYFEGVNAATYLIYGWADFRWLGFVTLPFAVGAISMLCIRAALGGSALGIMLGVIQFQAVIYSPGTDVLFDPTASIVVALSAIAWLLVDFPAPGSRGAGNSQKRPGAVRDRLTPPRPLGAPEGP